jgi:hypothetical protein
MKLFYCGFNEFGQCPSASSSTVSHLIEFPLSDVEGACVSWSCVAVLTGKQTADTPRTFNTTI